MQFAFQILALVDEACLLISFRVGLRCVHIAFSVERFIPFPVDDRTASHAHLEHLGIVGDERDGHESTKAPAMHADAVGIHIGQRLQVFHAFHLVFHFLLAQVAECGLFECQSTVARSAVVQDEEYISFGSHIRFPSSAGIVPTGFYVAHSRTTVNINHGRIFLVGVKVVWLHHTVVEVGDAVGRLDGARGEDGRILFLPGVVGGEIVDMLACMCIYNVNDAWHIRFIISVKQQGTRC